MKVASIFSGIGGFEKGILQAEPTTEIVFSSEIDKYARTIYNKNFGVEPHGDITKIKATNRITTPRTESNLNLVHDYIQHNPGCTQRDILTFTDLSKHVVELYYNRHRIKSE